MTRQIERSAAPGTPGAAIDTTGDNSQEPSSPSLPTRTAAQDKEALVAKPGNPPWPDLFRKSDTVGIGSSAPSLYCGREKSKWNVFVGWLRGLRSTANLGYAKLG